MPKTVLVTGARGFLGFEVAKHFASLGYYVDGMGHGNWDSDDYSELGIRSWVTCDISLDTLIECGGTPDIIIHCAGSGSVPFSMSNPFEDFSRTVLSTLAVLEFVKSHSPKSTIVYPSSAAVYGEAQSLPINECDSLLPISPYGFHKLTAENLCKSYATNFGVSVAIIRFFSLYGEGLRKQLFWDACIKAKVGDYTYSGSGMEIRDWIHIEDAVRLIEKVINHASPVCPVVNGGSGKGLHVKNLIQKIYDNLLPDTTLRFIGKVRLGDPLGFEADIKKSENYGWKPEINIQIGVKRYVTWFLGLKND